MAKPGKNCDYSYWTYGGRRLVCTGSTGGDYVSDGGVVDVFYLLTTYSD